MDREKEIKELRERLKLLNKSKWQRFNALIREENYQILEKRAKQLKISKSKLINQLIEA